MKSMNSNDKVDECKGRIAYVETYHINLDTHYTRNNIFIKALENCKNST